MKRKIRIKGIEPFRIIQEIVYGAFRSDPNIDDVVCDVKEIYYLQKRVCKFLPLWINVGLSTSLDKIVKELNDALELEGKNE